MAEQQPDGPDGRPGPSVLPAARPSGPARRRRGRRLVLLATLTLGLCGLAAAAAGVATQLLPRHFTVAQQHRIERWEVARRWRTLPESAIFPAAVTYRLPSSILNSDSSLQLKARRLAVSGPDRCAAGASGIAAAILRRYHCQALLRATYTDSSGSMVATVGVAVLPDSADAASAQSRLGAASSSGSPAGVRPARVPGTVAAHFGLAQRQLARSTRAGPYVILTTAGYADGRPRVHVATDTYLNQEMSSLASGLSSAVSGVLGQPPRTPDCPGSPGC